jgi:hypothetical protein
MHRVSEYLLVDIKNELIRNQKSNKKFYIGLMVKNKNILERRISVRAATVLY